MSVRVQVRVFGGVDVVVDGRVVDLGHVRQRSVFAVLVVLANRPVSAELLVDYIWDETPPPRGRDTLYTYLSRIRTALATAPGLSLVHDAQGYRLIVDETAIDLHRFRALVTQARASTDDLTALALLDQALTLSQSEPFAGLTSPWLTDQRNTVAMERYAAELDRTDRALRSGQHSSLVADLSVRVAEHPLDERLAGQYLLTLYRTGRQADAITHYQRTRATLAEQLGCRPTPALQAIYQQILAGEQSTRPTPAPRAPAPRQLPPAPASFAGREPEIATLASGGQTVVISAIAGTGGIGKTWLALHWAYQHLDQFTDGQLFVDLRGFAPDGQPVTAADAIRGFLVGLGVPPDRIPVDPDAQTALYRGIVAGKHMLIVLDNAADAAQVTPLLPDSDTCTVLITSRRQLPGLGAHHIRLDVLSEPEARELLADRLGVARVTAEAEAVETLLACCGGFPLALGIVIGRALTHPNLPLSVLAAELGDETDALAALATEEAAASLPAVLSWSTRALPVNQARVFALLGIAPGSDISVPAAGCLAALPAEEIRTVLRQLADASLIQQHMPGRYRMHDLIRRYATDTAHRDLTENMREEALRRVVDYYTHTAYAAEIVLHPHPLTVELDAPAAGVRPESLSDVPAALAWFDTEHSQLLAVQRIAAEHAWHRTVWQLAWTLDTFLSRRGHCRDRLVAWQAALDAATHLPEPARTIAQRIVGNVYADLGCLEQGVEHLHQALALAEEHHDQLQQAHTHQALAWVWTRTGGDDRTALEYTIRARDLYHTLDQPVLEASMLNSMGWFAAQLGDRGAARNYCQTALVLHQRQNYDEGAAAALDSLGYIEHHSGHHKQAIGYYEQAITLFRAIGSRFEVATTLDNLGHPHVAIGQYEQARAAWSESLELYQEQGRDSDAARVQQQLDAIDANAVSPE